VTDEVRSQLEDERQQRLHHLLSGGGPATPPTLRARIATPSTASSRAPWWAWRLAAPVAVVAAAVLAVVLVTGTSGAPSVAEAARPSALAATGPAPAHDAGRPELLRASFAGVDYPDWQQKFAWRATGLRSDTVEGRRTETVFYQHTHHRIGYTVVNGAPLDVPEGAERLVVDGVAMRAYKDGARDVVVFERGGRTCVLAGKVHRRSTLLKLASWRGDGAVSF
jgi:hypothetical protein